MQARRSAGRSRPGRTWDVLPLACDSRYLPRLMKVMSRALVSKKLMLMMWMPCAQPQNPSAYPLLISSQTHILPVCPGQVFACWVRACWHSERRCTAEITEYAYAALVPSETSTSMLAAPCRSARSAPAWKLQPITNCSSPAAQRLAQEKKLWLAQLLMPLNFKCC